MRNPYEVLEVARDASDEDIKKAYRRLVMQFHPDRAPGDTVAAEKFKEVQAAYEAISDPQKRHQHEHGQRGFSHSFSFGGGDIFETFFGDTFRRSQETSRGQHIETELRVTFMEAARGCKKSVNVDRRVVCTSCNGSGAKEGQAFKTCTVCEGQGRIVQQHGVFRMETGCNVCRGQGKVIHAVCPECTARGYVSQPVVVEIEVPAGCDNGTRLVMRGQGDVGTKGSGDLFCVVRHHEHALFQRRQADLLLNLPLSFSQAALGATVEVPGITEKTMLVVPPGTRSGSVFRVAGMGLPRLNQHGRGDFLVTVEVDTPVNLTDRQKELLVQLIEADKENVPSRVKTFVETVNAHQV